MEASLSSPAETESQATHLPSQGRWRTHIFCARRKRLVPLSIYRIGIIDTGFHEPFQVRGSARLCLFFLRFFSQSHGVLWRRPLPFSSACFRWVHSGRATSQPSDQILPPATTSNSDGVLSFSLPGERVANLSSMYLPPPPHVPGES